MNVDLWSYFQLFYSLEVVSLALLIDGLVDGFVSE